MVKIESELSLRPWGLCCGDAKLFMAMCLQRGVGEA